MVEPTIENNKFFDLTGKKALVSGAGRGIGKAVALGLARAGADIGLVARTESEIDAVAGQVKEIGRRAAVAASDLTVTADIPALVSGLAGELGGIDILVNNAGTNIPQDSVDVTEEAWDSVMAINLKSSFFMAQAVGKVMIEQGRGGRIINMSSQTGSVALIKRAAYCASKAGLNLVTKVLAMEWGPHEILVNAVAPTFVETEMTKPMLADPQFREYALAKNVLKRFGTTDDVAGAVIYLASPAANLVTGHILLVDAGWTAH
ncbi:Oxidoreductase, short-chain dehydrogenase/reductase family [Olavius sp. associated proteobacterium Delta 1]|nr:Oxidoreductase, short-chain dehydrogenase/reductase family [Olavius sp. associated proteobacterium Delta 1]